METRLDTDKKQWLEEKAARVRAEALLLEKEQYIAQLLQEKEALQAKLSSIDGLKKELHYVNEIVNSVQDIIFISDDQGLFRFINPAAEKLLGFPLADMLGTHYAELIRDDYAEPIRLQYLDQIRHGMTSSYVEFPVKNVWQREIWLGQRVTFIYRDGKFFEAHSISRDITEEVHARKELVTTYSRLKGLVQNLHAGVLVEDENRKIVLINQQFCDLFSIPVAPQFLIGADCAEAAEQSKGLFYDPEGFVKGVDELLRKRELTLNEDLRMQDGKILERHYIPVFSGAEYLGHMWHYRDVSAQRMASESIRKSEEKYRGIMENMELGLLEVNSEAKILRAYPRFCEMVGYSEQELLGQDPKLLFAPPNFKTQAQKEEAKFLQGKSVIWEAPVLKKNGSIVWALINNTPIYDELGNLTGTLGIHLDITEQKLLQADLERAREEAEQARDAEKAFLANMSHEIRNPINSIVGMTNLLYDTQLSPEQAEYVHTLQYSAELLQALVSDVLDISKIEQGKMEPHLEDFDFFGMAKAMCKTFEFRLSQRPIEFQCEIAPDVPEYLRTDPTFLNQILLNLINNSFKFTEQGFVRCTASTKTIEGKNWIEFTVTDTGIGIPEDRLPFIFERFDQAGKAKRTREGAGLGLPITKQLVELLGGRIQVQSIMGGGTSFTVLLPFETVKNPVLHKAEVPPVYQRKGGAPFHVLIVEDNAMNSRYLENLLQKWGLTYATADDGLVALQATEKEIFDLILMDIRMPNLDGYETTLRLRNAPQNANQQVPIIALTASALLDEKVKALQAGMNQHLSKPFTPEQLLEVFRQVFPGFSPQAPSIPPFSLNRTELAELYEGDTGYMREIFAIFAQTVPNELAQMRELLEAEDWKAFAAKAHKIKPSFQMVGLGHLSARAEQLERAKRAFDPQDLIRDFGGFEAEVFQGIKLVLAELATLS